MFKSFKKRIFGIHEPSHLPKPLKQKPTNDSILCDCSECETEGLGFFETLPLKDGHFTSAQVHKCKKCGKIGGFPQSNLETAIKEGTPETQQALREVGVPVDEYLEKYCKKKDDELNPSRRDEQ
jgi:Fe2+ or Zn2+ uptake regulation protein